METILDTNQHPTRRQTDIGCAQSLFRDQAPERFPDRVGIGRGEISIPQPGANVDPGPLKPIKVDIKSAYRIVSGQSTNGGCFSLSDSLSSC